MESLCVKLSTSAILPRRGTNGSAGYDLCANEEIFLPAGERRLISTGISMAIPEGYYGRIAPRSGLAWKHGLDVLAGVIDSDYRGEIKVVLQNLDPAISYKIQKGDRIAQLIFERYHTFQLTEVDDLTVSKRDEGGFGSTGV